MAPERHNAPTALTINKFTRPGYTFANWATKADGSGRSYANGDLYPFTSSITLYAQWRKGKAVTRSVAFNANGGSGAMAVERDNTPTGLTGNRFARAKFTFVDWNTSPNGSGTSYPNGAIYPFNRSVTLYAQWRAVKVAAFTVTFNAHGGSGTMTAERHNTPAALTNNRFRRAGYGFLYWSTGANGSGARYANGGPYPFTSSVTLYAQWRRYKVAVKPAVPASASIGPFASKSSTLPTSLQAQVATMANAVKANRDRHILLIGYGDKLSTTDARNESVWAANITLSQKRSSAVEAYLKQRLTALGVTGFTITAQGNGAVTPGSSTNQRNSNFVFATLS
jgi:outer membrane protein OmpA-like peptidoglycan-associated protein